MTRQRRILVTGAGGFVGKNLVTHLNEDSSIEVLSFSRGDSLELLSDMVIKSDTIVHLAGENRPKHDSDYSLVNVELTRNLCQFIRNSERNIPLIFISSTQAKLDNPYGQSKLHAEQLIENFLNNESNSAVIFRLPGVFGKWCRPNYNSVVSTFCFNIAHDLPIKINDPSLTLQLVYIDDVINEIIRSIKAIQPGLQRLEINQIYEITLGQLAEKILAFHNCRSSLTMDRVGIGLTRALYLTYLSYLPTEKFIYSLPQHTDDRGNFVEILKTRDSGQFSFFTIKPGITRGSHYHHSKTEKFIVVKGLACIRFRHLITGETGDITISSEKPQVVDSIPGWVHDITNIGENEAIVMLWANEIFDRNHPDCIPAIV